MHAPKENHPNREKSERAALGDYCARLKPKSLAVLTIRPARREAPSAGCWIETISAGAANSSDVKKVSALSDNR